MTKDTISLINFFKNLWAAVKDFTFKTRIVNQVEFPEISMPKYPDNIEVNNLIDYTDVIEGSSSDIIRYLNGAFKKLEPKNENTTKFLDKIKDEIREIKKVLDKKDLTPNVIKEIKDVVKSINNIKEPSFDLSGLEKRLTKLKKDLTKDLLKFTRYDEIKVRLPDSQVEEIGKTVIASGGGSTNVTDTLGHQINPATEEKQDDVITELEKLVGFEIPAYDYIALSYTGDDLTGVVYKDGGSGGTTVATLTLAYTAGVLQTITKT